MDDSGGGGGSVPTHQKYKTAAEALERTHEKELEALENLTQKAIDVVKVDLLSLSLLATGLSFAPGGFSLSLLLVASVLSFLYAIWTAVHVFDPTRYERGIGSQGGVQIDRRIQAGTNAEQYYRQILYSYVRATEGFSDRFKSERKYFRRSVWSTYAGVLFLTASALNLVYLTSPLWAEVALLTVVVMLVTWGSNIPAEAEQ
jgi:hypothetical protein